MPYRLDLHSNDEAALERLIELGALDVEVSRTGERAAVMPDAVTPDQVRRVLGNARFTIAPATARDAKSVWVLSPRAVQIGRVMIVPAGLEAPSGAVQLIDAPAFGTGLHPTTALCVELLSEIVEAGVPGEVLDVGTGSGVLALAALRLGVPRVVGTDIDEEALQAAAENARLNGLDSRMRLALGGPESIEGSWPLVLANVLAAPLIEMAPALVRRVAHHGRLVLSGIPQAVEPDVGRAYRHLGMRRLASRSRDGWVALVFQASW